MASLEVVTTPTGGVALKVGNALAGLEVEVQMHAAFLGLY
jgi:hypothetical protein